MASGNEDLRSVRVELVDQHSRPGRQPASRGRAARPAPPIVRRNRTRPLPCPRRGAPCPDRRRSDRREFPRPARRCGQRREAVGEAARRAAGDGGGHHRVMGGLTEQSGAIARIRLGFSSQPTKAVPSCAAAAPRRSAAAMPAPSMMPPAAIHRQPIPRTRVRVSASVPSRSSAASGSKMPRWPPASQPWATIASTPAASARRALRPGWSPRRRGRCRHP